MTGPAPGERPAPGVAPAPGLLVRVHSWVLERWPTSVRRRIAVVAVLLAVGAVATSTIARFVGAAIDAGVLAYVGLMVVCWVGAGGALVPVPGVRPLSWVMIVHQGAVLIAPIVALVAALAMVLGQSSYYLATRAEERHANDGQRHRRHRGIQLPGEEAAATGDADTPEAKPPNRLVARSRALLEQGRTAVKRRMATHPRRIVFLLCVVPNPLTTFATITAASIRMPFARFFVASLAGYLVLTTILVIAGQGILAGLGLL